MPSTQELNRRIKSIKNTRKITKAMQLVSGAKLRRAQTALNFARIYSTDLGEIYAETATALNGSPELFNPPNKEAPHLIVLIASNKGLVGSLNSKVFTKIINLLKENPDTKFITVGKLAQEFILRLGQKPLAHFSYHDSLFDLDVCYPITSLIRSVYFAKKVSKVEVIYTAFYNSLSQKPEEKKLLPLRISTTKKAYGTKIEPQKEVFAQNLFSRMLEGWLFQSLLEAITSEHAARMVTMKSATDAAGDLIDDLTLTFNQLRQTKITTELLEITAGKTALESN